MSAADDPVEMAVGGEVASELHVDLSSGDQPVLEVHNLVKHFAMTQGIVFKRTIGWIQAVDDVSFAIRPGETLGLVGESGSGKSTVAQTLLRLHEATGGRALYKGDDLFTMSASEMREARRGIQMIFQDPYASLNPRMTVGDIVAEPWRIHADIVAKDKQRDRVAELLDLVGLNPDHINRFPHQFSGGQRQRIGVARALALNPSVIIADEPVSALDVSVQAQVVNLLEDIQDEFGIAYLFIAHDLSVVRHIADRVAVMYLGKIVEIGTEAQIYERPTHPYTQALLSAAPIADPRRREESERILLEGDLPSPANPPSGCRFRTRCWLFNRMAEEDRQEAVQDAQRRDAIVRDDEGEPLVRDGEPVWDLDKSITHRRIRRCIEEVPALDDRGFDHPSACHYAEPRQIIATVDVTGTDQAPAIVRRK